MSCFPLWPQTYITPPETKPFLINCLPEIIIELPVIRLSYRKKISSYKLSKNDLWYSNPLYLTFLKGAQIWNIYSKISPALENKLWCNWSSSLLLPHCSDFSSLLSNISLAALRYFLFRKIGELGGLVVLLFRLTLCSSSSSPSSQSSFSISSSFNFFFLSTSSPHSTSCYNILCEIQLSLFQVQM